MTYNVSSGTLNPTIPYHWPTIDRIEPLLQHCGCSSKTMMNFVSNRVHQTINKLDKTARLIDIIRSLISRSGVLHVI